jgi:hypothetical protein
LKGEIVGIPASLALLAMVTVTARVPDRLGLKRTWKVVAAFDPIGVVAWLARLKSRAAAPVMETCGEPVRVRSTAPLLLMVEVCDARNTYASEARPR